MTPEEITDTYAELEQMFVPLVSSPEKGLNYIKERLTMTRAMQDRIAELRLKVNRALSVVLEDLLVAKQTNEIQPTPDHKIKVKQLEVLKQRHEMLSKMTAMQSQVLSRTGSDIRLLATITTDQIKRKEINPDEAPGLVKDTPVTDMAGIFKGPEGDKYLDPPKDASVAIGVDLFTVADPGAASEVEVGHRYPARGPKSNRKAPELGPEDVAVLEAAIQQASTTVPQPKQDVTVTPVQDSVQTVGLDAPIPPDDRMRLPDTRTVDFNEVVTQESSRGATGIL